MPVAVCVVLAGAMLGQPSEQASAAPSAQRPNFVIVMTDDQRFDTIGRCLPALDGNDLNAGGASCMPYLQQHLVTAGTTFKRGYVTTSLCCPARTSMLSGLYARHTGVLDNQSLDNFQDASTLATWLDQAGYRTGLIGKYTNGYGEGSSHPANYVPPGWDSWHAFWGRPSYISYSLVHKDPGESPTTVAYQGTATAANYAPSPTPCVEVPYSTDHLCSLARDFVTANTTDPFFLLFTPYAPHLNPIWASRHDSLYRQDITLPTYPNYNQVPQPNPPSWLPRNALDQTNQNINAYGFRGMLRANRAVDDSVHALHEQLRADGRLDDTVWIYLSDNGLARTEFRYNGKACEYEICHRVPFIVVCPQTVCPDARPGAVDASSYALNIDIAPTIAELAGITPPTSVDGRSLVPLLGGTSTPWRSWFLLEDHGLRPSNRPLGIVARLEDGHDYKFVRFLSASTEFELFDLTADPWEMRNLAFDPAFAALRARLESMLDGALHGPAVTITSGPPAEGTNGSVAFSWTSNEQAVFECVLDGGAPHPCGEGTAGSASYTVAPGAHVFGVTGIDAGGSRGAQATWSFSITGGGVLAPPSFGSTPASPSSTDVTFTFSHPSTGVGFACAVDGGAFASCASPHRVTGLGSGEHTFHVRAVSGSSTSEPITHRWSVDAHEPVVTITSDADRIMTDNKIGITWSGTDDSAIVRYEVFRRSGTRAAQALVYSTTSTTDLRFVHTGTLGTTYCYQVVGVDQIGRRGTSAEICRAIPADDRDPAISVTGAVRRISSGGALSGTLSVMEAAGQRMSLSFNGRRFALLARQSPSSGIVAVSIDGGPATLVDLYASSTRDRVLVFQPALADAAHTVTVSWTGQRHASSSGTDISIDGFGTISWGL